MNLRLEVENHCVGMPPSPAVLVLDEPGCPCVLDLHQMSLGQAICDVRWIPTRVVVSKFARCTKPKKCLANGDRKRGHTCRQHPLRPATAGQSQDANQSCDAFHAA